MCNRSPLIITQRTEIKKKRVNQAVIGEDDAEKAAEILRDLGTIALIELCIIPPKVEPSDETPEDRLENLIENVTKSGERLHPRDRAWLQQIRRNDREGLRKIVWNFFKIKA